MLRVFADNDVLLDAAHWGFLDYLPSLTGAAWQDTTVPESLRHRTRKKDPKLFAHPTVAGYLLPQVELTAEHPGIDLNTFRRLEGENGLDGGEVILVAGYTLWVTQGEALFLTGDKRALRALAQPHLADIATLLRGRVLCREHLLRHVLNQGGIEALMDGVNLARGRDTATDCIIPSHGKASESSVRDGLDSYLRALARETNGLVTL